VVIGASAGGVEALSTMMAGLPADFPAAIVIALHLSPHGRNLLPDILNRRSAIKTTNAHHGEAIHCGRAYMCVPDHHLIIRHNHLALGHGPKENGARPAIDVLFRSAAVAYGARVIGLILTGNLDDGTAGFVAIKRRSGLTVAQDPAEALFPSMPQSAIANAPVDHVVRLEEIAPLLQRLVTEPVPIGPAESVPDYMRLEVDLAGGALGGHPEDAIGEPASLGCPDCGGPLRRVDEGSITRFRCHVGHAWSEAALAGSQGTKMEEALWTAIRWLDEEESLAVYGAERARNRGNERVAGFFTERAARARQRSTLLRNFLRSADPVPGADDPEIPQTESARNGEG
jgi:two-component system chemotaxis response regulator CheB